MPSKKPVNVKPPTRKPPKAVKPKPASVGERIASDFVGPHPTLAHRIDAAVRRAVRKDRSDLIDWLRYQIAFSIPPKGVKPDHPLAVALQHRENALNLVLERLTPNGASK
jgi:hypothetical protein